MVYKLDDWNNNTLKVHEQRLCKAGSTTYFADAGDSTTPIYLYNGSYKIFCYSFNKTTADKLSPLANGAVNVPLSEGDDFLSTDIISLNIAGTQLGKEVTLGGVTLKHRCCRLTGTLKAEAFEKTGILTSPTPSLKVTSTFTTTGHWSIKNTNFSGSATSSADKVIPLTISGNDYTGTLMLLPFTSKPLTASYTFKPNGAARNVSASNKSISSSATFASNYSYSFTIKAIGAYMPSTENPVQIGDYKWANANLDHTGQLESNTWVSGRLNGSDNDYWRWNVKEVDTSSSYGPTANTWNINNDPCRTGLASPWKVPPKANFENLVGYKLVSKKVYINGTFASTDAHGYVSTGSINGCVFVDPSRGTCIFLPAAGDRYGSSYYDVTYGYYWSGTCSSANTYAYALYFNLGDCSVDIYRNYYGYSVRCSQ